MIHYSISEHTPGALETEHRPARLTACSPSPMTLPPGAITGAIARLNDDGDPAALDELLPLVYEELRTLARRQRRRAAGAAGETINTTGLVHEVYLKLVGADRIGATGRAHFFALAARAMRQVLSNQARARRTGKRGSGQPAIALEAVAEIVGEDRSAHADTLVALDDALNELARRSARQSRVVECRFYAGMSVAETALALGVSEPTVKRDWALAQAWLYRELRSA